MNLGRIGCVIFGISQKPGAADPENLSDRSTAMPQVPGTYEGHLLFEDDALIKKILIHLGLWETRNHDPPQSNDTHIATIEIELTCDDTYPQLPPIDYWTQ